MLHNRK